MNFCPFFTLANANVEFFERSNSAQPRIVVEVLLGVAPKTSTTPIRILFSIFFCSFFLKVWWQLRVSQKVEEEKQEQVEIGHYYYS